MTLTELEALTHEELRTLVKKAGGQRAFARKHAIPRTTIQNHLYKSRKDPFSHRPAPRACEVATAFEPGEVKRFILTSAQDGTRLHEQFLTNLEAYRDWLSKDGACELMVAGFTYNKSLFQEHSKHKVFWPERILPYMTNERTRIADKVDFCGEMNTLPTAEAPLSGFEAYTRDRWGVFPHAKLQLVSVPTMSHQPAKQIMTTGAITMPNYVPKKAGIKASFHHIFGAVLVEVNEDGHFFCRHLIGDDEDGSFYDLDRYVCDGQISEGNRARALTPGDVHVFQIDPEVSAATFGLAPTSERHTEAGRVWERSNEPSLLDRVNPEYLLIHDVCDFRVRNHHSIADPHDRYRLHINGTESVEEELREVAFFLTAVSERPGMETVVVESNHDLALRKWLSTADYRYDPPNARFFLQCQLAVYMAIEAGLKAFSIFEEVMRTGFADYPCSDVRFLRENEEDGFSIDGVEMSQHGHNGPNGARGNIKAFAKVAAKMTVGHSHSCGITGGAYQTGTTSLMDMGYNRGPGSWSHTHVVQYQSGKRALITINGDAAHL